MSAAAPTQPKQRQRSESSLLAQARIFAIIPLGEAAIRVPDLLQQGQYIGALHETLVAAVASLVIAGAYRATEWIMSAAR